ncbi:hypothetical protein BN1708_019002, partial [Verticillium longisporum]
ESDCRIQEAISLPSLQDHHP